MNHYYNSFLRNTYTLSILIFILIVNCSVVFSQDFTNVRVNHITTGEQVIWGGNSLSVSGNRIYVLWQDRGNDFSYVSKSTDGGTTFNNGVKIGGSDPQIAGSITTDNSGSVYAAWTGEGWNGIYFAKSTNEAATFSAPLTVSLTGAFPQIAVHGSNVYIFFVNSKADNKYGYFLARSTNGGNTFEAPYEITDASFDRMVFESPNTIYVDNTGNIYCVWNDGRRVGTGSDIYLAKSTNSGVSFGTNIMVNAASGSPDKKRLAPTVAVSGSNVYVTFRQEDYNQGSNRKVLFSKSINGGSSFSAEKEITGCLASPYMAINSVGEIYIAYPGGSTTLPTKQGLFCTKSNDQGNTFSVPTFISSTNTNAKNPSIYVDGNDILHAVWAVGLDSNQDDIYFAKGKIIILTAPTATAATAITKTGFTANWNEAAGANGYYLDVATNSTFTNFVTGFNNKDVGNVKTFTLINLVPNTPHFYRVRAYNSGGTGPNSNTISITLVSVEDMTSTPIEYKLEQNYPNPFNPITTIKYSIPGNVETLHPDKSGQVATSLRVYDILGKEVAVLVNEKQSAGNYEVQFDGSKLASGVYFYKLSAGNYNSVKKIILVK